MNRWLTDVRLVAAAEWCAWRRSRLALAGSALLILLLLATTVLTALRMQAERAERLHQQSHAEAAFLSQPDRHPHRMVHYGHYVFRTPTPLAVFDPGLDAVTGTAVFLEGHRQNTAMFADAGASADLGALSWLSPASVYQLFGPLLLILLGHGLLAREREAGTLGTLLAQGVPLRRLLAGKAVALAGCVVVLLLPLACSAALALSAGESLRTVIALLGVYGLYLGAWAALVLLVSVWFVRRSVALGVLVALWITCTLVLPTVAATAAAHDVPLSGKLESDLAMLSDLRKLGDGHNANDPAFAQLRAEMLKRHGVQRDEDLPVNWRGVVAEFSERKLTETLNAHAQRQRAAETDQANRLARYGWFAPVLAVAEASRALAATDLRHYHRFLAEAEALRYDFVQGLNRVHAGQLRYADDVRRSSDPEAERRTRVAAANWQLMKQFRFQSDAADARIAQVVPQVLMLLLWCGLPGLVLVWVGGRPQP